MVYRNLDPSHGPHRFRTVLRWGVWDRLTGRRVIAPPGEPAPIVEPDPDRLADPGGPPRLTWLGHASWLGTLGGRHFLIDPVLSRKIGFLVRRHGEPPLEPRELPPLSLLLVSHNHYDHLDAPTVEALRRDVPVVVPRGLGRWFRRRGFDNVAELAWWDSHQAGGFRVTLVPARHWSRRTPVDTNRSWWGGFVVERDGFAVYHAGDSGWFPGFAEIGRRHPGLAAAMLPVGAYAPAWFMEPNHLNPEQACRAFLELGARRMLPMHWGTFALTDEPLAEPARRVRDWWAAHAPDGERRLHVAAVGQTVSLDD